MSNCSKSQKHFFKILIFVLVFFLYIHFRLVSLNPRSVVQTRSSVKAAVATASDSVSFDKERLILLFRPQMVTRHDLGCQEVVAPILHFFVSFQAEDSKERLEAAHHHTIGRLSKATEDKFRLSFSPPVLAAVAKLSLNYIEETAIDIEAFSR